MKYFVVRVTNTIRMYPALSREDAENAQAIGGRPRTFIVMEVPQCKNCKWWSTEPVNAYPFKPGWGECKITEAMWEDRLEFPESQSYVGGDGGILNTHETFGCIQFEAKE